MGKLLKFSYVSVIGKDEFKEMPWKNGYGVTHEIALLPNTSKKSTESAFLWRLSTATISQSAPFSIFPECDRILALLDGGPIELAISTLDQKVTLHPGSIHRFAGDKALDCTLLGNAAIDLNLIYCRGLVKAEMHWIAFSGKPRSFSLNTKTTFFYIVDGQGKASVYPGEIQNKLEKDMVLHIDAQRDKERSAERLVLFEPSSAQFALVAIEMDW